MVQSSTKWTVLLLLVVIGVAGIACTGDCDGEMPMEMMMMDPPDPDPVEPPLSVVASVDRLVGSTSTTFKLTATVNGSDSADVSWDLGDGNQSSDANPDIQYASDGQYLALVTVRTDDGREAEDGVLINVISSSVDPLNVNGATLGDVNDDGRVSVADAHMVSTEVSKLARLSDPDAQAAADINRDGRIDDIDVELLTQMVFAGSNFPTAIEPTTGAPGSIVNLMTPTLFEIEKDVAFEIPGYGLVEAARNALGYATLAIPIDVAGDDPTAISPVNLEIRVLIDGATAEVFIFDLQPTPPIDGPPGQKLRDMMMLAVEAAELLDTDMQTYLDSINATDEERAVLRGIIEYSRAELETLGGELEQLIDDLDEDNLKLLHWHANAGGLPRVFDELNGLVLDARSKIKNADGDRTAGDNVIDAICRFKQLADFLANEVDSVMTYTCIGAGGCAIFTCAVSGTGIGAVVAGAACGVCTATLAVCAKYSAVSDFISIANEFVPEPGQVLLVTADPTTLETGEMSTIDVKIELDYSAGLCLGSTNLLVSKLQEKITQRLIKKVVPGAAKEIICNYPLEDRSSIRQTVIDTLKNAVSALVGEVISATGIDDALTSLRESACGYVQGAAVQELPLGTDTLQVFEARGDNPGTLTAGAESGTYECPDMGGSSVEIVAERDYCGKTIRGSVTVSCGLEDVMITMGDNGNLLDDIFEVQIDGETVLTSSSPVRNISTTLSLAPGEHEMKMIGRAAPDGIGTYFVTITGAQIVSGPPLSGSNLSAGTVFTWTINVEAPNP